MKSNRLLIPTALLVLASLTSAQEVTFRGQVEDVQGTANQYFVDCTDVQLVSPLIDLAPFVSLDTEITGTWNGSIVSPSIVVSAIQAVAGNFEIGGSARIGETLTFGVTGNPGELALMFYSTQSSFVPFQNAGAIMLDLGDLNLVGSGVIGGAGILERTPLVPNDPGLVGLTVFGQAILAQGPGAFSLTNSDCKTLRN